jgi:hypothetical protein
LSSFEYLILVLFVIFLRLRFPLHKRVSTYPKKKCIQDLLDHASLTDHRIVETPIEFNVHLRDISKPLTYPTRYHHIVVSLVYLDITRPNISHSVHILSQFVLAPT